MPLKMGSRLSLTAKVAAVIISANLAGLVVTTYLSWSADLQASMSRAEGDWIKATQQIAATAEGAVKWKKASVIQEAYALYRADPGLGMTYFLAENGKGEVADSWSATEDKSAPAREIIDKIAATGTDKPILDRSLAGQAVVVAPLGLDKSGKRLGYVSAAWSSAPIVEAARWQAASFAGKQALVLALVVAAFLIAMRQFSGLPLARLARRITAMQQGDLDSAVPMTDRSDAIGVIAKSLDTSIQSLKDRMEQDALAERARREMDAERSRFADLASQASEAQATAMARIGECLETVARGDFSTRLDAIDPDFDKLRRDFNTMVDAVSSALAGISATAQALDAGAYTLADSSDNLAKRTEMQAAALEQTAAALEQITRTVALSTERADAASGLVRSAKHNAHGSAEIVRDAIAAMDRIETSSSKIGTIIGAIDEIAFQTNLLALNAGVEAARAGEAGKGFAVVAQEVRELAQRSASAAKEIKQLVSNSGIEVGAGVELVNSMGSSLLSIEQQINEINDAIMAIVSSSREQSVGLSEVNSSIRQMDQSTQQNAVMVEETNAACQELRAQSNSLKAALGRFGFSGAPVVQSVPSPARPVPASKPVATSAPVIARPHRAGAQAAIAASAANWEEF